MERIFKIVVEQLGVDEALVKPNNDFIDDLGADDLDVIELVMAFEEEFDITITDAQIEKMRTVQDAYDTIMTHY